MSYVLIEQNLEEEDEPRFIYAELDSGRGRSGGWNSTPMASALPTAATTAGRRLPLLPPTRRTCGR